MIHAVDLTGSGWSDTVALQLPVEGEEMGAVPCKVRAWRWWLGVIVIVIVAVPVARASVASGAVIAAAGDIACDPADAGYHGGLGTAKTCRQLYTSDLLVAGAWDAVLPLGDNQYECGGLLAFQQAYASSWGRVDPSIVHPIPGDGEYLTSGGTDCSPAGDASGYYSYFGSAAGDPTKGYYSYDVGDWHMIALNAQCSHVPCKKNSVQEKWLVADLQAHTNLCTLVYWHQPHFSSAKGGGTGKVAQFWTDIYNHGADIVLHGHAHIYERFAPMDPTGAIDAANGVREFIVGTGGKSHGKLATPHPSSEVRDVSTFGVLKLTLDSASYSWQFMPAAGAGTFTDSGSYPCH